MERKLATIREITAINPIPDADQIERVSVGGWDVVAQKNQGHEVSKKVLYFEIDSFLPWEDDRFAFLMNRGTKTNVDGKVGHVLKTIKLRGTYSQGLILPIELFLPELGYDFDPRFVPDGTDVTELLGITKWEPPIPAQLQGQVKGNFPGWLRKTDAERVQNLTKMFPLNPDEWVATEKIDGTSATYAIDASGEFWVCSRNMALKEVDGNVYWDIARKLGIEERLRFAQDGREVAIVLQGEIYGPGIQKNPLGVKEVSFAPFNLQSGANILESHNLLFNGDAPKLLDGFDLPPEYDVPVPSSAAEAIEQVEGLKSRISPERQAEGLVWWNLGEYGERNWKAINNKFLLKSQDKE